jgi:hypothetical protein
MPLDLLVKNPQNKFSQSAILKQAKKSHMGGMCLALSCAFIHLKREGLDASDIILYLKTSAFTQYVIDSHEKYQNGGFSDGSLVEMQDNSTINSLFKDINAHLLEKKQSSSKHVLLNPAGTSPQADRLMIAKDLLTAPLPCQPKLFLLVFTCDGGRMRTVGAHAIAIAEDGIFDPNFGWMPMANGMNTIERSVMLNEFVSEYGIPKARSFQDVSSMLN